MATSPLLGDHVHAEDGEEQRAAHLGANYCTTGINTSEIIVDLQWHFPIDVQWSLPTEFDLPVVFSKELLVCNILPRHIYIYIYIYREI